eukprot:GEMP01003633.1.p1 GENE.GEMP01003633.1~~GEMP01003633.1.p1  ORF type:complete len:1282 (+),score=276.54 GEMP01003633.1:23-3868(+)
MDGDGVRAVVFDFYESPRGPVVRIFGPGQHGGMTGSCCVRVFGFFPFFYVQNDVLNEEKLTEELARALQRNGINSCKIWVKRRPELRSIYGVHSPGVMQLWTDRVSNLQPIATLLSQGCIPPGPMPVFELHIPYLLHFMEQTNLVGMGWLPFPASAQPAHSKTTTCAIEIEVQWRDIVEGRHPSQTQAVEALSAVNVMTAGGSVERLCDREWLLKGLRSLWVDEATRNDANGLPPPEPPPPSERSANAFALPGENAPPKTSIDAGLQPCDAASAAEQDNDMNGDMTVGLREENIGFHVNASTAECGGNIGENDTTVHVNAKINRDNEGSDTIALGSDRKGTDFAETCGGTVSGNAATQLDGGTLPSKNVSGSVQPETDLLRHPQLHWGRENEMSSDSDSSGGSCASSGIDEVKETPASVPPSSTGFGWHVFHRPPPPYNVSRPKMSRDTYGRVTFSSPPTKSARCAVDFGTILSVEVIVVLRRVAVMAYSTGDERGVIVNCEVVHNVDVLTCLEGRVTLAKSERDLVNSVDALFARLDPQVVLSYNVIEGIGRIIQGEAAMARFSRSHRASDAMYVVPTQESQTDNANDAKTPTGGRRWFPTDHLTGSVKLTGRIVLSLWRVLRSETKLNTTELSTVCEHVLGAPVPYYTEDTLARWLTQKDEIHKTAPLDAVRWCARKADVNLALLESLDVLPRAAELAKMFGCDMFSVFSRGSQYRVECVMLRAAHAHDYLLLSPTKMQVRQQPAMQCTPLVMEPMSNFYWDPVLVLDFQSLYPSIVIAFNICYATCLGMTSSDGGDLPARRFLPRLGVVTPYMASGISDECPSRIMPNGAVFRTDVVGVLPRMLQEFLQTRIMIKRSLKQHQKHGKDTSAVTRLLDARQFGLKMIANTTYGYTAASFSGRMPCAEIADAIVQTARRSLEKALALVEDAYGDRIEVLYGDTDSLFLKVRGANLEEAFQLGADIAALVSHNTPWPMELNFEKVYYPCCLFTKKRYCGMMYTSPDGPATLDAKGIEIVRRDQCAWTKRVMVDVLTRMFFSRNVSAAREVFVNHVRHLRDGTVPLSDLLFFRETRRREDYKVLPPHAYVVDKLIPGMRVAYGIERGGRGNPNEPLKNRARAPHDFHHPDTEYYIFKQIVPALKRAFGLVGEDVALWASSFCPPRHLPTRFLRCHWTREARNCVGCGITRNARQFVPNGSNLCQQCYQLGPRRVWFLPALQNERRLLRRRKNTMELCTLCAGGENDVSIACASFACGVWGERRVMAMELERVERDLRGIRDLL